VPKVNGAGPVRLEMCDLCGHHFTCAVLTNVRNIRERSEALVR